MAGVAVGERSSFRFDYSPSPLGWEAFRLVVTTGCYPSLLYMLSMVHSNCPCRWSYTILMFLCDVSSMMLLQARRVQCRKPTKVSSSECKRFFLSVFHVDWDATFSLLVFTLLEPLAFLLRHLLVAAGEGELLASEALVPLGILSCRERVGNAVSG